jgi:preprotein translocase subunit SecF
MKHLSLYFLISALIIIPGVYSLFKWSKTFYRIAGFELLCSPSDRIAQISKDFRIHPNHRVSGRPKITLKTKEISQEETQRLLSGYNHDFERIGPSLGKETIKKTINALLISSFLLLFYISAAFKQFKYGLCAVLAMLHDTIVLIGSFSLLGHFYGVEVDLLFVTAVLTILSFRSTTLSWSTTGLES